MPSEPPPFENNKVCSFCGAAFSMMKRKHHCRMCGKTACDTCSMKEAPIPAFGFTTPVRVCNTCYDTLARPSATSKQPAPPPSSPSATTASTESKKQGGSSDKKVASCTCNMPLCICAKEEAAEAKGDMPKTEQAKPQQQQPKPAAAKAAPAQPSFFNGFGNTQATKYDLKGDLNEQCRDAVKAKDTAGVKLLLEAKADGKYVDSRGNSLVHLAAMFDKFEMVKLLVEHGADVYATNPAGERAIDLAPPALQFKMQQLQPQKK